MALAINNHYGFVLPPPAAAGADPVNPQLGQFRHCTRGGILANYFIEYDLAAKGPKNPEANTLVDAGFQARILVVFESPASMYAAVETHVIALCMLRKVFQAGFPVRATLGGRDINILRREMIGGSIRFTPLSTAITFFVPPAETATFEALADLQLYVPPAPGAPAVAALPGTTKGKRTLQRAEHIDTNGRIRWKTLYRHGRTIDISKKWLAQGCSFAGMRNYPWPFTLSNLMVALDPSYWPCQIEILGLEKFLTDLLDRLQLTFKSLLDVELTYSGPAKGEEKDAKNDGKKETKHPIVTQMIHDLIGHTRCIGLVITAAGAKWSDIVDSLSAQQNLLYKLCQRSSKTYILCIKLGVQHPGCATSVTPPWYYRELKGPNSLGKGEVPDGLEIMEEIDDEDEVG